MLAYVVYSSEHNTYECVGKNRNKKLWPFRHKLGTKVCRSDEANEVYNKYTYAEAILQILSFPVASAPTNLMAVQEGLTGIRVSWTPPTPLGNTTGFRIYYSGGSSGSEDVSGGSTDNYTLTGLQNGANYTISIVGTSQHLPSDRVDYPNSILLSEYFLCQCLRH